MKKSTRIKSDATSVPVPQNRDEVNNHIARIGLAQRERARIQADMNDELAKVKLRFEETAKPFNTEIEMLSGGIQIWCEAHRHELTRDGKVKFHHFAAGEIKWRMRPQRVSIRAVENVLETLKRLGLTRFIRVKEEPNKDAMLAEPDAVSGLAGIRFEQKEDFVIIPFETELEEVT
ncbi:host-nuclease inhibitor protein Gam [Salmonella enterica subsp. enterica serovar Oranienburg]|nr:host-nuclease inhibitor protein Gam [Salmonella enterica subsp. enterica serovar Oranienburg]ECD5542850.1 host-nuclease inhibitor protein Gam [Salmonella enterica subsp. enterica serovar Kokomlemle]HAF2283662.1 host-nuclease inhibitor protein Gam [Salmonella enterica]EBX4923448.1 host-nuclease inhibitor protein Gam [Salmonella enterica subsp. enterica serovar Oranienburg]EDT5580040.1 host-nuclease inhibitor protein Gam [Salmonella enterica subsp. enterica serovar Kokomlemle]